MATVAVGAAKVEPPATDDDWHPVAKRWFNGLKRSGQVVFYEPSDWETAYLLAETISRELKPQPVVVKRDGESFVEMVSMPLKGTTLSALLKGMTDLMVTEVQRRRARVELQRPDGEEGEEVAGVSQLDEYRRRVEGHSSS